MILLFFPLNSNLYMSWMKLSNSSKFQKIKCEVTPLYNRNIKRKSFNVIFLITIICISSQITLNDYSYFSDINVGDRGDDIKFKINQWTVHSPIHVHGITNFSQTAIAENWFGSGTQTNPYIIENYYINNSGNLIVIEDTPFYFIIRSCILTETSRLGSGIVVINSSNGIIARNEINDAYYGMEIIRSNNTRIQKNAIFNQSVGILLDSSHGNTIEDNDIMNNYDYGVYITNYSSLNTIAWNLFNNGITFDAFDSGSNNIFAFNYWWDLTSPDNDDNGIVDVPYLIDGEANNRDKHALVEIPPYNDYPNIDYPTIHVMLEPKILYPNGGEIPMTEIITIQWLKALDSQNHQLNYSLDYSVDDETTWVPIISGLTQTYFEWDSTNVNNYSTYKIRVTASCSEGLNEFDLSDNSFSFTGNPTTTTSKSLVDSNDSLISIIVAFFLILLLASLPIVYRKREFILNTLTSSNLNSLQDLLRKRAVPFDTLKDELQCSSLELPNQIKHDLGQNITGFSLVYRSGMISLENIPPSGTMCQVCTGSLDGKLYFQCESCLRYVCLPHFVDLKELNEETCPNCDGRLFIFPFTCKGCNLDYNRILDMESNMENCKHCGFSFPNQNQLILDNTKHISSSIVIDDKQDYFNDKDKKSKE